VVVVAVGGSGATPIWHRLSQGSAFCQYSTSLASTPARSTALQSNTHATPRHATDRPPAPLPCLVNPHFQSPMPASVPCCARWERSSRCTAAGSSDRSILALGPIALATNPHDSTVVGLPSALNLTLGVPAPKTEPSPNSRIHLGPVGVAPSFEPACHKVQGGYSISKRPKDDTIYPKQK